MEHAMICLEEQQDEFDFKYQTHQMEGRQIKMFWSHFYQMSIKLRVPICFGLSYMETTHSCGR